MVAVTIKRNTHNLWNDDAILKFSSIEGPINMTDNQDPTTIYVMFLSCFDTYKYIDKATK